MLAFDLYFLLQLLLTTLSCGGKLQSYDYKTDTVPQLKHKEKNGPRTYTKQQTHCKPRSPSVHTAMAPTPPQSRRPQQQLESMVTIQPWPQLSRRPGVIFTPFPTVGRDEPLARRGSRCTLICIDEMQRRSVATLCHPSVTNEAVHRGGLP